MSKSGKTKYALLGVLSMHPASGYDIKKFWDSSFGFFWQENYGNLYPLLQRMEHEQLISKTVSYAEGKPSKNIYTVTDKGLAELYEWLMIPPEAEQLRSELLMKLFLSREVPVSVICGHIRQRQTQLEHALEQLQQLQQKLQSELSAAQDTQRKERILWLLTADNGAASMEAQLAWCRHALRVLEEEADI